MEDATRKRLAESQSSEKKELRKKPVEEDEDPSGQPRVILKLFIHTVAMFTLPFVAYYMTRNYVHEDLAMSYQEGYIYGAVAAVVVVNLIIASYVYQALAEDWNASKKSKTVSVKALD